MVVTLISVLRLFLALIYRHIRPIGQGHLLKLAGNHLQTLEKKDHQLYVLLGLQYLIYTLFLNPRTLRYEQK